MYLCVSAHSLVYYVGKKGYHIVRKVISVYDKSNKSDITIPTFALVDIIIIFERDTNGRFEEFTPFEQSFIRDVFKTEIDIQRDYAYYSYPYRGHELGPKGTESGRVNIHFEKQQDGTRNSRESVEALDSKESF